MEISITSIVLTGQNYKLSSDCKTLNVDILDLIVPAENLSKNEMVTTHFDSVHVTSSLSLKVATLIFVVV